MVNTTIYILVILTGIVGNFLDPVASNIISFLWGLWLKDDIIDQFDYYGEKYDPFGLYSKFMTYDYDSCSGSEYSKTNSEESYGELDSDEIKEIDILVHNEFQN